MFENDLERFARKTGLEIEKVVQKLTLDAWNGVTKKTPVDTGRARANWNVAEGRADTSTTKSTKGSFKAVSGKKDVYITNSLDYIGRLENGSSRQAPNGMVAVTFNDLVQSLK